MLLDEKEFKERFITKLNNINSGWRDGDLDNFVGKKSDIVNDQLKIVFEIKDDIKYKMVIPTKSFEIVEDSVNLGGKNRQFKYDLKDANKKFLNYPGYKSIVILRTEMSGISKDVIEYTINGPKVIYIGKNGKSVGVGSPSTFWGNHDNSTREVGVILFLGCDNKIFYRENTNPNINRDRIIKKQELEKIIGNDMEYLND